MSHFVATIRHRRYRLATALLCLLAILGGCGGDAASDRAPDVPSGFATIDASGGRVVAEGAEVLVPPGALREPATIRIARGAASAGGSPPLPGWIRPVGEMLELTPHGSSFIEPVTVRLRTPQVTLAADERLLIAKVQPGGEWELLAETALRGGMLDVKVDSFSYFTAAVVRFLPPVPGGLVAPAMFNVSPVGLTCEGRPCAAGEVMTQSPVVASLAGNGGAFPQGCNSPEIELGRFAPSGNGEIFSRFGARDVATPYVTMQRSFSMPLGEHVFTRDGVLDIWARLVCADPNTGVQSYVRLASTRLRAYSPLANFGGGSMPRVLRLSAPTAVTEYDRYTVQWLLAGSYVSAWVDPSQPVSYQPRSDSVVNLERLRSGTSSWETLYTAPMSAHNPSPTGASAWTVWGWEVTNFASAADNGANFRLRTCVYPGTVYETCAVSAPITMTVAAARVAPSFTRQPSPATVSAGQTASFVVQVGGVPAPQLQWQTRPASGGSWTDVPGATGTSFTTPALQPADSGVQYQVLATNSAGTTASELVTVTVAAGAVAPAIIAQPQPLTVIAGSQALFAAGASGTSALSYQWSKDGTAIAGANAAQLLIDAAQAADAGSYRVTVSNAVGSATSNAVTLTVNAAGVVPPVAPGIVTQPAAVAVTEGNSATFAVGATGTAPLAFQWRRNGVPIPGATAAALTIPVVLAAAAGDYSVVVSNAIGSATSQTATLAVAPAAPAPSAPTIVQQPGGVVAVPGLGAVIGVTASGSGPLSYRWFRNGVELPAQSGAVLVIASAGVGDGGSYRVEVSNAVGTATSNTVQLALLGAPAITLQPTAAVASTGGTTTFVVAATGDALRYQWLRNGAAIAGATAATHITPTLTAFDSGTVFSVVVFNAGGAVVSAPALLTVTPEAGAGVLLAHEGFAYTPGDTLAGKSGGSGWSGAWTATDGYLGPLAASGSGTIVAGLGYTDSGGRQLAASGGAWASSAGVFFGQIQRATADKPGAAGSTRWVSFIVRQDAAPTGVNYVSAALGRGWSFGSAAAAMGTGIGGTGVFVNCWYCSGSPATSSIAGWAQGATALLLMRFDFATTGNDTVSIWVNPTLDPAADIGAPAASASLSNFAELLDGFTLGWGDFRSFTVDELRIGTGRAAVLPVN